MQAGGGAGEGGALEEPRNAAGTPTSITFFARPFGESELLAVVKAYQDATGFHLTHPALAGS